MVVAETMIAFSLVKGAVELCKNALDTAEAVKGIYSGLDQLFKHRDAASRAIAEKKKQVKPKSKLRQMFTRTTQEDDDDDLSVGAVAAMVIEQKKLDREILNLSIRINNKFGSGTWEEIREQKLAERKVQKAKDKKAAKQKALDDEETHQRIYRYALEFLKIVFVVLLGIGMAYTVWINRCQGAGCI